jgi:threonylcarbamoyladenosine tRNA methylthiotransferase MtaB
MQTNNRKVSFYTLGCRLNQAESGLIAGSFRRQGYNIVEFGQPSDVCVINSCTVTNQADSDCRKIIHKVLRDKPDTYIAVIGCYAQIGSQALTEMPGVDLVVGTEDKFNLAALIETPCKTGQARLVLTPMARAPFRMDGGATYLTNTRAHLKIQDGCDFMCGYCIVPFARGRARSREIGDIRREAEELLAAGYRELVVTGVNIGAYEFAGQGFIEVVEMLLGLSGLERLRLSSIEPTTISARLLDVMAASKRLCRHLHMPLQSGSDEILRRMKRRYTSREYLDFVELAANKVPDMLLATDIIVGYPGETEETIAETKQLFIASPLAYAHVFAFSERRGTYAERLDGKVDPRLKKKWSQEVQALSEAKKQAFYAGWIGREVSVLLEEQDAEGRWLGCSGNYIKVAVAGENLRRNQMVNATILSIVQDTAQAEVI